MVEKSCDAVEEGDILAEIETDKATMEFESFQSGTLLHIGLQEGESAKVDALLAILGPKGTDVENIAKNFKASSGEKAEAPKEEAPKAASKPEPKAEAPKKETPKVSASASTSSSDRVFVSPIS